MTEMRSKVWNIDTNFVVFKKRFKNKSKNLCLFKFGVLGYRNFTKIIENHVYIRSTDHFKPVGVRGKMTEMKSIMWMTNAFGCTFA